MQLFSWSNRSFFPVEVFTSRSRGVFLVARWRCFLWMYIINLIKLQIGSCYIVWDFQPIQISILQLLQYKKYPERKSPCQPDQSGESLPGLCMRVLMGVLNLGTGTKPRNVYVFQGKGNSFCFFSFFCLGKSNSIQFLNKIWSQLFGFWQLLSWHPCFFHQPGKLEDPGLWLGLPQIWRSQGW